ncbi:MAG: sirohydrochlorin chelatase [Rhodoferax sp.]
MSQAAAQTAIVLLAHGSRDPLWHRPMEAVAARIAARAPGALVRCAYMELSAPDLDAAVDQLVASGAAALRIVPMFLGVGKHAREDLPRLVEALRKRHASTAITLQRAVGEEPDLIDLLAQIALSEA